MKRLFAFLFVIAMSVASFAEWPFVYFNMDTVYVDGQGYPVKIVDLDGTSLSGVDIAPDSIYARIAYIESILVDTLTVNHRLVWLETAESDTSLLFKMPATGDSAWVNYGDGSLLYVGQVTTKTKLFSLTPTEMDWETGVFTIGGDATDTTSFTGPVGIGTTGIGALLDLSATNSDSAKLQLGTATFDYNIWRDQSNGFLTFQGNQSGYTGYYFLSDDNSYLATIIDNGSVGIGANDPDHHYTQTGAGSEWLLTNSTYNIKQATAGGEEDTAAYWIEWNSGSPRVDWTGPHPATPGAGTLYLGSAATDTITTTGPVNIGSNLDVTDDLTVDDTLFADVVLATGTITGKSKVVLVTGASYVFDGADSCRNYVWINDDADAVDFTLPGAEAGLVVMFYDLGGGVITVDPVDGTDTIYLNGTAITAGNAIDSPGAVGDFICLIAVDDTRWITAGRSGTWVDGGAD